MSKILGNCSKREQRAQWQIVGAYLTRSNKRSGGEIRDVFIAALPLRKIHGRRLPGNISITMSSTFVRKTSFCAVSPVTQARAPRPYRSGLILRSAKRIGLPNQPWQELLGGIFGDSRHGSSDR